MAGRVERQVAAPQDERRPGQAAPGHRPHPGRQLVEAERLDHIVVSPTVESGDPVGHPVPSGEHHHRKPPACLTQPSAHLEPVASRQHHIQHDRGVVDLTGHPLGFDPVATHVDRVALLLKAPTKQSRQTRLVLGYQQSHHEHGTEHNMRAGCETCRSDLSSPIRASTLSESRLEQIRDRGHPAMSPGVRQQAATTIGDAAPSTRTRRRCRERHYRRPNALTERQSATHDRRARTGITAMTAGSL